MLPRLAMAVLLALVASLSLSACGVRGSLEAPPEAQNVGNTAIPGSTGDPAPKKGFVLDPLLR
ncbi:MAG: lipoprotein [Hyphomicrobiaceae bacterium]|nr:lipoprotein [Hyphomicrobiaceae bacterium]